MTRKGTSVAAVALLLAAPVFARQAGDSAAPQAPGRFQAAVIGGAGSYTYFDNIPYPRAVIGTETCSFCGGRYGLFAGYRHFFPPGPVSRYKSSDLFDAGLRIQGRSRVAAFFDVGFAAGHARFGTRGIATAGGVLGVGAVIRAGEYLYVRPQVRLYVMSEAYFATGAEVGVGWRF